MRRGEPIVHSVFRTALHGVVAVLLLIGCSKDTTSPGDDHASGLIGIEAESFARSHNGGGAAVTVEPCSGASAQHATEGVDFDGDWIEIDFALSESACFSDSLRGEGMLNDVRRFAVLFYRSGAIVESDTLETPPGKGFL